MLKTNEIKAKYGEPGDKNLVSITLPFALKIAWDLDTKVKRMKCHKLVAVKLQRIFAELLAEYGYEKIVELGIDIFGGCYNYRKMRGGNDWSRHAWAIALDFDPERNGLNTKWSDCQLAKPEYKPMIDIFYRNGFVNQGIEKGFDGMHFEVKN